MQTRRRRFLYEAPASQVAGMRDGNLDARTGKRATPRQIARMASQAHSSCLASEKGAIFWRTLWQLCWTGRGEKAKDSVHERFSDTGGDALTY
jgi:hypothetical protein